MVRPPKTSLIAAEDLQDAVRQVTTYLQQTPLATAALLALALAIGAGANSIGRRSAGKTPEPARGRLPPPEGATGLVKAASPPVTGAQELLRSAAAPVAAAPPPVKRLPRRRKGLAVATFELDQKGPDGRKTGIDFTWTAPKRKPGVEPEPVRREPRVGVALFEFSHVRPGGKDTAIKFGWSKEPLEPAPAGPPAPAKPTG